MEIWKDIPGFEGYYQVSNLGNVKSLDREVTRADNIVVKYKGKNIKKGLTHDLRIRYKLSKNGKSKHYLGHYLVMLAFVGERPKGYEILHSNGDCQDNRLANLSYDTQSQNRIDDYRHGKKNANGKLSIEEVLEIRRLCKTGKFTNTEIAKKFNVLQPCISNIASRRTFKWLNDDGTIDESKTAVN